MPKRTRDHQSWLLEKLTDPHRASLYLKTALEDSEEMFLEALRDVAQAAGMTRVAKGARITRKSVYDATSDTGNPTLETLAAILKVLDLKLSVEPIQEEAAQAPPSKRTARTRKMGHRVSPWLTVSSYQAVFPFMKEQQAGPNLSDTSLHAQHQTSASRLIIIQKPKNDEELWKKLLQPRRLQSNYDLALTSLLGTQTTSATSFPSTI